MIAFEGATEVLKVLDRGAPPDDPMATDITIPRMDGWETLSTVERLSNPHPGGHPTWDFHGWLWHTYEKGLLISLLRFQSQHRSARRLGELSCNLFPGIERHYLKESLRPTFELFKKACNVGCA